VDAKKENEWEARMTASSRMLNAPRELVWKAISNPEHLMHWWGPNGFTNTFSTFDFKPGGKWSFTMIGPDGTKYPNESVFAEMVKNERLVIEHVNWPRHHLAMVLEDHGAKTKITWMQIFDSLSDAKKVMPIAKPSNEQNFDRLEAQLKTMS
jgi:uncharacterized protein YndB with AHSA1/START domain